MGNHLVTSQPRQYLALKTYLTQLSPPFSFLEDFIASFTQHRKLNLEIRNHHAEISKRTRCADEVELEPRDDACVARLPGSEQRR